MEHQPKEPESGPLLTADAGHGRTYSGVRHADGTTAVSVDGKPLDLRRDFRTHSATAFDWGYSGSGGPTQLALAILADHWADDEKARRYYELFVQRVVCNLPRRGWSMTGLDIDEVLSRPARARAAPRVR